MNAWKTDGEFECTQKFVTEMHSGLDICARDVHVPEVEQYIRRLKEPIRSVFNAL